MVKKFVLCSQIVDINLSLAYLRSRYIYEGGKAINDNWLSQEKRVEIHELYVSIGKDVEKFFSELKGSEFLYLKAVYGLETFRDNLDIIWCYAYGGSFKEIKFLSEENAEITIC